MIGTISKNRFYLREHPVLGDWLFWSCCFSIVLSLVRIAITGSTVYVFMPWNLFLAFVPYWISGRIMQSIPLMESKWKLLLSLAAWLLFIPNSFYIITDLFHLTHIHSAPKWFDLLLLFSFAWNGIIFGVISLKRVETILTIQWGRKWVLPVLFVVMWLIAFGIYIGRYLRFNSWDVLTDPLSLAAEIVEMVINPLTYGYAWGMTFCYAVFMMLLYMTVKKVQGEVDKFIG
jgi:uncharacterized membrane protein